MKQIVKFVVYALVFGLSYAVAGADENNPQVRIQTNLGDIVVELDKTKTGQESLSAVATLTLPR